MDTESDDESIVDILKSRYVRACRLPGKVLMCVHSFSSLFGAKQAVEKVADVVEGPKQVDTNTFTVASGLLCEVCLHFFRVNTRMLTAILAFCVDYDP